MFSLIQCNTSLLDQKVLEKKNGPTWSDRSNLKEAPQLEFIVELEPEN
jgi:hypothetical protein